jgi:hypothetical protein
MHIAQIVDARFLLKQNVCHVRVLLINGAPVMTREQEDEYDNEATEQ